MTFLTKKKKKKTPPSTYKESKETVRRWFLEGKIKAKGGKRRSIRRGRDVELRRVRDNSLSLSVFLSLSVRRNGEERGES